MPVLHSEHQSPSAPVPTVTTRPREQNTAVQLEQHTRQTAELQDSQQLPVPPALYPNLAHRPLSSNHQLLDVNRITSRSTPLCLAWNHSCSECGTLLLSLEKDGWCCMHGRLNKVCSIFPAAFNLIRNHSS